MKFKLLYLMLVLTLSACGNSGSNSNNALNEIPIQSSAATGPVILIGDSITQFWGNGEPPSYPTAVPSIYQDIPDVIDVGIAGQQTSQMLARFQTDVLDKNPSVVVILGGTNDIFYGSGTLSTDNIATMAEAASAAGAHIIIGLVPPTNHLNSLPIIQNWNAQLRTLAAAYGYTLADYYDVMVNADGSPNLNLFLVDEIHPNSAGYAVMWTVLQSALNKE